jgi:hypothetical protein
MENSTTELQANDQLENEFELVKSFYEFPRMNFLYLDNYFKDLKVEIDLAFLMKRSILGRDREKQETLNEKWIEITNRVNAFQRECLEAQDSNFLIEISEETQEKFEIIKLEIDENELNLAPSLLYDERSKIEKQLLKNKTIAFLDSSILFNEDEECQDDLVGKLLIVKDEYIGNKGLDYIRG